MVLKNETGFGLRFRSWEYRSNRRYQCKTRQLVKKPPTNPKDALLNFKVADHQHECDSLFKCLFGYT
jgi:hypothetical protein